MVYNLHAIENRFRFLSYYFLNGETVPKVNEFVCCFWSDRRTQQANTLYAMAGRMIYRFSVSPGVFAGRLLRLKHAAEAQHLKQTSRLVATILRQFRPPQRRPPLGPRKHGFNFYRWIMVLKS